MTRIHGKYIKVDRRRVLKTVKGGGSGNVTVQRLKIPQNYFYKKSF